MSRKIIGNDKIDISVCCDVTMSELSPFDHQDEIKSYCHDEDCGSRIRSFQGDRRKSFQIRKTF